jgi:hypothetical protein
MSTIKTPPPPLDELRRSALTERIKEQNRVIRRNRDVIARQRLGATVPRRASFFFQAHAT